MTTQASSQPIDQQTFLAAVGQKRLVHVKIAEAAFTDEDVVLVSYGLGSCVAVCLLAPHMHVGALMHALLPKPSGTLPNSDNPYKFVRPGILALVDGFRERGIPRRRLVAFLTGGANMLKTASIDIPAMRVGERNVMMARAVLRELQIPLVGEDVGGQRGRSVLFDAKAGVVYVKTLQAAHMYRLT